MTDELCSSRFLLCLSSALWSV